MATVCTHSCKAFKYRPNLACLPLLTPADLLHIDPTTPRILVRTWRQLGLLVDPWYSAFLERIQLNMDWVSKTSSPGIV